MSKKVESTNICGVTEIFITRVKASQEEAYRKWTEKIHSVESRFPGFQKMHIQTPEKGSDGNWITLLHFDTTENLMNWLTSKERKEILLEGEEMIQSIESHRVLSPFAGWFGGLQEIPAVWKQTMLVLLGLFPIVMLELKFLYPLMVNLNPSLSTFIGNTISVTLVSWPMMPIAIYFLGWWLDPSYKNRLRDTILGTFIILILYALEILLLWKLL